MSEPSGTGRASVRERLVAWSVHALTASGAVWGLLAVREAGMGRARRALVWLTLAALIDAIDGALARRFRVGSRLPEIDGRLLDNLVDFVTYVVAPAYLMLRTVPFPPGTATAATSAICLASALQFSNVEAKTPDHRFLGFPSYWNVVALYLLVLRPSPVIALATVAALCLMLFVPVRWVYPTRTERLKTVTLGFAALWGASVIVLVAGYPDAPRGVAWASLAFPLYYVVVSLWPTGSPAPPAAR